MTEGAGLWGGLATRLPAFADGRPAPVGNRRAGWHPAPSCAVTSIIRIYIGCGCGWPQPVIADSTLLSALTVVWKFSYARGGWLWPTPRGIDTGDFQRETSGSGVADEARLLVERYSYRLHTLRSLECLGAPCDESLAGGRQPECKGYQKLLTALWIHVIWIAGPLCRRRTLVVR